MNILDFKIAIRNFIKGKWYSFLNIAGLALGLSAFIFVTLYIDNETSYDQWNKNIDHVFLVESELSNGSSPYTPGKLAAMIKSSCPEVEETGRTNTALFQLPFYTSSGRFMVKKWIGADYSIAKILGIKPKGFNLKSGNAVPTVLLSKRMATILFPGDSIIENKTVNMGSRTGMAITISGVADDAPGNTNFNFDCIGFSDDITSGKDESFANQIYQTYLLVKPNTDIGALTKKIDKIYQDAIMAGNNQLSANASVISKPPTIYLDPLKNLHLRPHYASNANDQVVKGLAILAIIVLIVTAVNFTNLYISQANKRSKEVGIKKVNGIINRKIIFQFLMEIFFQCLLALIVSIGIVIVGLPYFNQLLDVTLLLSGINLKIIIQLLFALISVTLLAGLYPAFVMARFKPIEVLKGNILSNGTRFTWIQPTIAVLQFTIAIVFVINLVIINQQVSFMKSDDPGFNAKQVVYIDNLFIYNDLSKFELVGDRIKAIPGVKNVTVASNVPAGNVPASFDYTVQSKTYTMQTIAVGYKYFETLNIGLKEGVLFSTHFPSDSAHAIINETAAKLMNLDNTIGSAIKGRGGNYKIIGIVKDVKSAGFEEYIQPVIYLMNDGNGLNKTQIMISAESKSIPNILTTLKHQWGEINKLDGDNFNYHFLDELYGQLYKKQGQLQTVLIFFSALAIFIAALGLFASAAQAIRSRMKEIAIRKIFGAKSQELLVTLSKPFFLIVLLGNVIAWPISFLIATKWLETFAYRIHISFTPFIIAMAVSIVIVTISVCLQIIRSVRFNPALKINSL